MVWISKDGSKRYSPKMRPHDKEVDEGGNVEGQMRNSESSRHTVVNAEPWWVLPLGSLMRPNKGCGE